MLDVEYVATQGLSGITRKFDYVDRRRCIVHKQDSAFGAHGNRNIGPRSFRVTTSYSWNMVHSSALRKIANSGRH